MRLCYFITIIFLIKIYILLVLKHGLLDSWNVIVQLWLLRVVRKALKMIVIIFIFDLILAWENILLILYKLWVPMRNMGEVKIITIVKIGGGILLAFIINLILHYVQWILSLTHWIIIFLLFKGHVLTLIILVVYYIAILILISIWIFIIVLLHTDKVLKVVKLLNVIHTLLIILI